MKAQGIGWVLAYPRTNHNDNGFTLIEVLVALTILSLSLAVLFAVFSQGIARTHDAEREMAARTLAKSLLEQAKAYATPFGDQSGQAPGDLSWQLHVTPFPQHDDKIASAHAAVVTATVSWEYGNGERTVTLTTLQSHAKDPSQ
jgi:general secretion pathway protein I